MTTQEANDCWDGLFTFIHANWAPPATAAVGGKLQWEGFTDEQRAEIADCTNMMKMSYAELEAKLETLPPYFLEHLFPVAVARYVLMGSGGKSIPFNHRKTTTFYEFHLRYGTMVLN